MTISDERLMAYADGELTGAEAAEVERAMAEDEVLAEKVAIFADSRTALRRALDPAPPVPAELESRIRAMAAAAAAPVASNVVDLASRRRKVPFWQVPLAASVALALGAAGGWLSAPDAGPAMAGLEGALDTVASGARVALENGGEFAAIATFVDGDGRVCREYEHDRTAGDTVVGVACRDGQGWQTQLMVVAAAAEGTGYAPASSLDALDAWMSATGAGAPLSPEEEAALLANRP